VKSGPVSRNSGIAGAFEPVEDVSVESAFVLRNSGSAVGPSDRKGCFLWNRRPSPGIIRADFSLPIGMDVSRSRGGMHGTGMPDAG